MKSRLMLGAFALFALQAATQAATQAAGAGVIELPRARFALGDDPARAQPAFDDSQWAELSTLENYEKQGFPGYDGYSWYRIHVVLPASLKVGAHWPQRLRLYLSSVDDVDETFLNGTRVGGMGVFPGDPRGYSTLWNGLRNYYVPLDSPLIRWDEDNVIAIRVYDGSGGGGFYRDMPTVSVAQVNDGLGPDLGRTGYAYDRAGFRATVHWVNSFPMPLDGRLDYEVYDVAAGRAVAQGGAPLHFAADGSADVPVTGPQRPGIELRYVYTEATSGAVGRATIRVPYLLTPPESPKPRINGARVLGARPGSPVHFRIPATGKPPLRYGATGLPEGLVLDAREGVISGKAPKAGEYRIRLLVSNGLGTATHQLLLKVGDTIALTPPMGWNSWNAYGLAVDAAKVRSVAQALVDSGLAAHGWTYINIDDGWEAAERAPDGTIRTNGKFPDMPALSSYLHERGLRFGIYSSPGALTCGRFLGSLGHERQDADTYAAWGIDYLKYDLCSYQEEQLPKPATVADHQAPYRIMSAALAAQPRDIVYSLCQYGFADVWKWGADVGGNSWRTTGDIEDSWQSVREIMASQYKSAPYAKPGHWNDPDMLVVGSVGWGGELHPSRVTPDEQYSHISLWSLLAAPLLLGNDLPRLDEFTRNLLTNDEVIAIDQDPLGRAARKAWAEDDWEIWVRELADGRQAVGVFNFGDEYRPLKLAGRVPALKPGTVLRDAWRQKDLGPLAPGYAARVPAHGVLLLVSGKARH